ncbi:MAG: hypothetical protein JSR49_15235, partial [Proteobacteria bacterium]|nr:hypothetical protein [Pseudomonadota bacterium]
EQRDRAARAGLELASWLGVRMQKDAVRVLAQQHVALLGKGVQDPADAKLIEQRRAELGGVIDAYRDLLHGLYVDYPAAVRDAQAAALRDELTQQQKPEQAAAVAQAMADIAALRRDGDLTKQAIERQVRAQACAGPDGRTLWQDACKLPPP